MRMCVLFTVATEKGQAEKAGKQVIEDKEDAMGETAEENRTSQKNENFARKG